ncbi:MAG TPA: amidohydrolase [Gaiellales bacterium]|nr:amidohydrolase [Gaiellales bacterium]
MSGGGNLAILGARIRTLDPDRPWASAVAIRDGVIVAVGDDDEVGRASGPGAEPIDGAGMTVVPGLTDSHMHPFLGALETRGADLAGAATVDEVRVRLAAERRHCGEGEWVTGFSLEYRVFDGIEASGELFEEAVGGNPALLTFFDFHTALATPPALAAAGIRGARSFDDASEIVCRPDGLPTGELREEAIGLVVEAMPVPADEQRLAYIAEALAAMNRVGLTASHMMDGTLATPDDCRALEGSGRLTVRQVVPFTVQPTMGDDEIGAAIAAGAQSGRLWRSGWAKFFIDGVVESGTAWLEEPDTEGRGTEPNWPDPERYAAVIARFAEAGMPSITHAIGDRSVRCALDAYRRAGPVARGPHRVEHIETLQDDQLPRFAPERVVASQQVSHLQWMTPDMSDPWSRSLGPERAGRGFRTAELRRSGAVLALGSDWPVAGFDPRECMAWARLRRRPGNRDAGGYGEHQRLSALEALEGYTTQAALAVNDTAVAGRIMPGYRGDLTAFAADPVDCDADDLVDLPVLLTVVDGRPVFRA